MGQVMWGPPGPLLSPLASFILLCHHVTMHGSLAVCIMIQCREQFPPPPAITPIGLSLPDGGLLHEGRVRGTLPPAVVWSSESSYSCLSSHMQAYQQ